MPWRMFSQRRKHLPPPRRYCVRLRLVLLCCTVLCCVALCWWCLCLSFIDSVCGLSVHPSSLCFFPFQLERPGSNGYHKPFPTGGFRCSKLSKIRCVLITTEKLRNLCPRQTNNSFASLCRLLSFPLLPPPISLFHTHTLSLSPLYLSLFHWSRTVPFFF